MSTSYNIFPLGDGALTVDFGNRINEEINRRVLLLFHRLQQRPHWIVDVVPAYSSLTVYYDVIALRRHASSAFDTAKGFIESVLKEKFEQRQNSPGLVRIPVCYEDEFAPDIKCLATEHGLSVEEVIRLHTATTYRVYMIGFLPGFAYLGKVHQSIATPRKQLPRTIVPAGAVGIAGEQTGIYPFSSPGGWNIIGQTPLKMFDALLEKATLLGPGNSVQFYSITRHEFENY